MALNLRGDDQQATKLWPQIVDNYARTRPDAIYGLWPVANDSYDAGFQSISYGQLANIINRLAWWIVKQVGPGAARDGDVLTYIGRNDVRLTATILASVKAGYTLFLTSPRNSAAAHRSLFETLQCKTLITTDPKVSVLDAVQAQCLIVPSVDDLLVDSKPFPYDKSFEAGRGDPLVIWHTSGSTGVPKPLAFTQEAATRHHACASQEVPQDVTSVEHLISGKRVMVTVPSFHGAGILQYMLWAIRANCIPIAPAAVGIVTAHGLADALKHTPADVAILVPSVVADLAQNPEQLDYCAQHLQLILYIGGDLPQAIGDAVAQKISLRCWWGASEVGIPHQLIPSGFGPSDWRYVQFHPSVGAVFDPISDGIYELVMRQDKALSETQSTFAIRGQEELTEYRTKDLFQPHPKVPNAWCWRSRADDIIVFLNGEKTSPVAMEQHIVAQHSELGGALVVGAQRFQAALLLEPAASKLSSGPLSTSEQAALIERVWPSVQEANQFTSSHAKIEKSMILVLDGPLLRAGKGTIQRAASIQQYNNDIETLYKKADITSNDEDDSQEVVFSVKDSASITRLVRASVCEIIGQSLPDDASFFESGMDSLMALQILRHLRRGLHRVDLGLSTIYANPTISQLIAAISSDGNDTGGDDDAMIMESTWKTYRGLIEQIPRPESLTEQKHHEPTRVILTGSTGTVGTFLLRALLDQPGIGQIYCLNRSENGGRAIQQQRMIERGFSVDGLDERVTFLQADLSLPLLGLGEDTYRKLYSNVDLVIHNAWPVNFNLRLAEFQPHLAGLVNLFRFSTEAKSSGHVASIFFVSSVSAVGSQAAGSSNHAAPEGVLPLADAPLHTNGYAQSKFLSELLCDEAAQRLDIPVTVLRVGQVAGAIQQGAEWNRKEWFPSLIIGSLSIGCVPDNLGSQFSDIDWLPVDLLAKVLVELVNGHTDLDVEKSNTARVYNLRNPRVTPWSDLLPGVIDTAATLLGSGRRLEVVSPSTWLQRLNAAASNPIGDEIMTNPAIKLLEFYENYLWGGDEQEGGNKKPSMSIERACAKSKMLRDVPAVNQQLIQKWMGEWAR